MIYDAMLKFGDKTDLSSTSTNAVVDGGAYVDLGAHLKYDGTFDFASENPNIGEDGILELNVKVEDTALAGSASSVLEVNLYTHSSAASGQDTITTSGQKVYTEQITGIASGKADGTTIVRAKVPANICKRYMSLEYKAITAKITAGKLTSWIGFPSATPVDRRYGSN